MAEIALAARLVIIAVGIICAGVATWRAGHKRITFWQWLAVMVITSAASVVSHAVG